jgi:hypothetical protein
VNNFPYAVPVVMAGEEAPKPHQGFPDVYQYHTAAAVPNTSVKVKKSIA